MSSHLVILLAFVGVAHQCELLDLSCQQIRDFVDGHNWRRLQLAKGEIGGQPAARNMNSVVWDQQLVEKANSWASQCPSGHNPDTTVPSGEYTTGENMYWFSTAAQSYELDPDSVLASWFGENEDYTYGPLKGSDFASSNQIGHYTQMIWSDTTRVGCAVAQDFDDSWTKFTVVCNYGPAGNMLGEAPYQAARRGAGELACGESDCSRPYGDQC